jgi:autotransporter-associated beta strand protein
MFAARNMTFAGVGYGLFPAIYWDGSGGTSWGTLSSWSTVVGGGTNPVAIPGASDVATFSATPIVGTAQTVNLNADRSVRGLEFLSTLTNPVTLQSGGATNTLTIGSAGVINAYSGGSGEITIGVVRGVGADIGVGPKVNIVLNGDQTWQNDGSKATFINEFDNFSGTNSTLTHTGTGAGRLQFAGTKAITGSIKFVQDSATSDLWLRQSGNSDYSGGVEVRNGVLAFGTSNTNLGTGTLTLGVNGGTGAVTARVTDSSSQSFANPILLATGHTGTITIEMTEDGAGVNSKTFMTGGIAGNNSFTIQNDGGNDNLNFSTGSINNVGTITHTGSGTGVTTINSVIGTNVTGLTQSGPARLVLGGTNTYTGNTTINAGTLALSSTGSIANSATIDVKSGATFDVSAKSGYTVGASQTLTGSGTVAGTTAVSGTLAPGNAVGTLSFQNALTLNAASIFEWQLNATNGADPGVVANSGTYDRVIATGNLTGSGAVFEVVLGSNNFSDAFWDSNKTWTNIFTAGNSFDLASIFTSFSGAGVDSSGAVSGRGSFSLAGNTLSWTVIP